ncbi:MAG: dipeptide ABC transporter ATP-binding protein [Alkalilacustris sp.]
MLTLEEFSVSYQTASGRIQALDRVSLEVPRGTTLALVGESGSGKSTAAVAAMGLLPPEARITSGRVLFQGQDMVAMTPDARRRLRGAKLGMVFQDPFSVLNPSLTIGAQVAEGLTHHLGLSEAAAAERVVALLDEVGIRNPAAIARAYPHELSGGMRQRVLIAGALGPEPDLLILDEPTTALDVTIEAQILSLLEDLRARRGLTMLFISHNLGVVRRIADRVVVLYAGQTVETGATTDVLWHPRHPYSKGLLAAIPRLDVRRHRLASIPGEMPDMRAPPAGCRFAPRCAFAATGCERPQDLVALGDRLARCHRLPGIADAAWPTGDAGTPRPPARTEAPVLSVANLRKSFTLSQGLRLRGWRPERVRTTITAIDDVSLDLRAGEVLGLVGESGSGKTTLGRTILRLIDPESGSIRIDGQDIATAPQRRLEAMRRTAQIVFQNPDSSLNPRKSIGASIARPLVRFGLARGRAAEARVAELLRLVRLPAHYAARYPHQLSGGEKQRVGIARALATDPRIIICDEPVSALDVSVQAAILNLLADLRDQLGVAYVFISHDMSVVAHLADRIAVMHQGKLVEVGTARQIMTDPQDPYTQRLIAAVPRVDAPEPA